LELLGRWGLFDGKKREECLQSFGRVMDANKLLYFSKFE